jgi:hypothetical protein
MDCVLQKENQHFSKTHHCILHITKLHLLEKNIQFSKIKNDILKMKLLGDVEKVTVVSLGWLG